MENIQTVQLYRALSHLSRKIHRMDHWREHGCLEQHALHHSQYYLLSLISQQQGTMQQDLAEKMDIRSSSMTELLGKLEQAGSIMRKKDDKDQRIMRVFITEKGKQIVEQAKDTASDITTSLFDCLSEEEQNQFLVLIQKVSTHIDSKVESNEMHTCHHKIQHQGHCDHHHSKISLDNQDAHQ